MNQLESALVIQLVDSIKWGAALPPVNTSTGTLTGVDPGQPFDVTQYARRDREFQHRDMVNAAAVAKVSVYAQTVWAGTVVSPMLQGVTAVTDASGTNVTLPPIDPTQIGSTPISNTEVRYVLNSNVPFDSIQVTDKDLYGRDLLLYETLARAATIFPNNPPVVSLDPNQTTVGSTAVWATAQGTDTLLVPNSSSALNQALFVGPDSYLANKDNQVAAYVSRVCQALKNPFDFATRIYVEVTGADAREVETYTLTNNVFQSGLVYASGEQVTFAGTWFQAVNTTNDFPPSGNWAGIPQSTVRQFLAEPALSSRNRILYDTQLKTLQWFRETQDTVHQPQIVGFYVPGVLPGQTIHTVASVPEQKDAQFYRQKASRVCLVSGTWSNEQIIAPTITQGGTNSTVTGGLATIFQNSKQATLMIPDHITANFKNIICQSGSYALNCLVRPSSTVEIAGGDNLQGSLDSLDGGVDFIPVTGTTFNWQIPLPAGGWQMVIEFANYGTAAAASFPIKAFQNSQAVLSSALPLYYTDDQGNPLPQYTVTDSAPIQIISSGQSYNFGITWVNALPNTGQQFHVSRLKFTSTDNIEQSHYLMQAIWSGASNGTNALSVLDVYGQHDMPDVMPFSFYLTGTDTSPNFTITWKPNTASAWQAQGYNAGDQVLFNLIYWQAIQATKATDIPGQSPLWVQIGTEPQLPLLFEQIQLQKLISTSVTPNTAGFEGFRQDMLERALRTAQDAYSAHLTQSGTNFPEFRTFGTTWDLSATGSWMGFIETYAPRLRETVRVSTIVQGHQYVVIGTTGSISYNGSLYSNGQKFNGTSSASTFTSFGTVRVDQVGAYTISKPGDVGKTGLIPAGLEYNQAAGTVFAWYPSYASYPTHQAVQPWMIEQGFYVAQNSFLSPDGNAIPQGGLSNPLIV
jgi:hypothetical protein